MGEQINQINQKNDNKADIKNHLKVLVLGVLSILLCYGIISLIFKFISLSLASKSEDLYKENPERHSLKYLIINDL